MAELSWAGPKSENKISRESACGRYKITGILVSAKAWRYVAWRMGREAWDLLDAFDSAKAAAECCDLDNKSRSTAVRGNLNARI
jgi:hypothetical protein